MGGKLREQRNKGNSENRKMGTEEAGTLGNKESEIRDRNKYKKDGYDREIAR